MVRLSAQSEIIDCRRCPRLVSYREEVARTKVRRYRDWEYWGRPVPSLGPLGAGLVVVGLAPAAHGGNRTGRIFTGDRSGDWLLPCPLQFWLFEPSHIHSTRRWAAIDRLLYHRRHSLRASRQQTAAVGICELPALSARGTSTAGARPCGCRPRNGCV